MTERSFDRAVRDWLEDGSDRTPPAAIDAVLLAIKTTPQERDLRIPRRFTTMPAYLRLAAGVAAVAIVALGALTLFGPRPGPGTIVPTPSPTATPAPTVAGTPLPTVPPLTQTFTSTRYGYSLRYPAGWTAVPAPDLIDRDAWVAGGEGDWLDQLVPTTTDGLFRMASVVVPEGVNATEWIARYYLSCVGSCLEGLSELTVDGQLALVRSDNPEREMILVLGNRAYFATLFPGPAEGIKNVPALFEAILATLDLRPEDAEVQPSPTAT